MTAAQLCGGKASTTFTNTRKKWSLTRNIPSLKSCGSCSASSVAIPKNEDAFNRSRLSADRRAVSIEAVFHRRKPFRNLSVCQGTSDCSIEPCDVEESHDLVEESIAGNEGGFKGVSLSTSKSVDRLDSSTETFHSSEKQSQFHGVKRELIMLSLPAIASQAIDPIAQLMETAYIGRLGPIQLAAAGVSLSIFNIVSKLFNIPLLSVAATFVAEDVAKSSDTRGDNSNGKPHNGESERKQLSSVSTALLLALGIGIIEASALFLGSGPLLSLMGVSADSPMRGSAQRFLSIRALGAPAVVLSLALQGILRGFKDTKTPVFCLGVANFAVIFLFLLFINVLQMGVSGAALATVVSQHVFLWYIGSFLMIWFLSKRVVLMPPKFGDLKFGVYLKSGGFLIGRTLALLVTMTIGTSMAARQGPLAMAAHQICLQVWLAVSLLTDALAASGQALVATSMSKGDYDTVKELTNFILKIGIYTGGILAIILGLSFGNLANLFTKDAQVLQIVKTGTLFVSASQPLNSLAFIFDGLHFGASDFPYAASSMILIGVISSAFLLYAPTVLGLPGVWLGLSLFMGLRMAAGYFRILSKNGPWWFLHTNSPRLKASAFSSA